MPTIKKYTLSEIAQTAQWLLNELNGRKVIALHGTMGAGKTTLVSAICHLLKVEDVVSSPTFSVINEYRYDENGVKKASIISTFIDLKMRKKLSEQA
ncbi:tRNA (adenosine(37)-N6)-threonylcarbamoyltransferase complex ATPase subunit type 1 TsaE [Niabella defluvii]|nr:tRNA (adenosine(37)-N6)-threonylcarbamoyltransferase complex ATPase subunit type 1 TsaE [Niabella sp. I65]